MADLEITIEKIKIEEHPNAERLEMAVVGMYHAIVEKGLHADGDYVIYIPEQSLVPAWLIAPEELNLVGRLAGSDSNRVKAIRLRGELSQGIVAKIDVLERAPIPVNVADILSNVEDYVDVNFAENLGIEKWNAVIPEHLEANIQSESTPMIQWTEIDNLQRYPDMFTDGEEVILTEKLHGTSCATTLFFEEGGDRLTVASKRIANKGQSHIESEEDLYWSTIDKEAMHVLGRELKGYFENLTGRHIKAVGMFGEVFGAGVQTMAFSYGTNVPKYQLFDAAVVFENGEVFWVDTDILRSMTAPVQHVPMLWRGVYDIEKIKEIASGHETISGKEANVREGVVIRPVDANSRRGGNRKRASRKIAKYVSPEYLLLKGKNPDYS